MEGPQRLRVKRKANEDISLPRYRRGYAWTDKNEPFISPSAHYSISAPPLPRPPQHLLEDASIKTALDFYGSDIRVETPFNIDRLASFLDTHPNQPLVESVLWGLRYGFWPLDDGGWDVWKDGWMENYPSDDEDLKAIRAFRDKELGAHRWSTPIPELLPGMQVSPLFVNRRDPLKPRVITDHSASGLNDGIAKSEAKVRYDDMHDFGQTLHDIHRRFPDRKFILYKSDVASAFLNLPAHPLWQLRQIVVVDGDMHIVYRLVFGSRASPRIWCAVSSLLCWVAIFKLQIPGIFVYMDDFYGWDFDEDRTYFHDQHRPQRQVRLLQFWDQISCPYEDKKQVHGSPLKIIGFWVDINAGSISVPPSSVEEAVTAISDFLTRRRAPLREWAKLAGHLNWILNVFPVARPALTELYRKMSGKTRPNGFIPINREVTSDLTWFKEVMPDAVGVRFIENGRWEDWQADLIIHCDATLSFGISYVCNHQGFCYQIRQPSQLTRSSIIPDIFFLEEIGVLSALYHAATLPKPPKRLLIYCDNLDSVQCFSAMRASDGMHNAPLLAAAGIILRSGIDLHVRHIAGRDNTEADLISRLMFEEFSRRFHKSVRTFQPPRELLPALWRESF